MKHERATEGGNIILEKKRGREGRWRMKEFKKDREKKGERRERERGCLNPTYQSSSSEGWVALFPLPPFLLAPSSGPRCISSRHEWRIPLRYWWAVANKKNNRHYLTTVSKEPLQMETPS